MSLISVLAGLCAAAEPGEDNRRSRAAALLQPYQVADGDPARAPAALADLRAAAEEAATVLGEDSLLAARLRQGVSRWQQTSDPAPAVDELTRVVGQVYLDLRFRPRMEAKLPVGFPSPAPVGEVVVKQYPAYRQARTHADGQAFWSLFRHIQKHEIAMTAPVEMQYAAEPDSAIEQKSMAFLYGAPDLGQTGAEGRVEVADVPPQTTIATGVRGARTAAALDEARERLLHWLDTHRERYQADGPLRVMGYNSPMMPVSWQFFEVEIPVRETATPVQ